MVASNVKTLKHVHIRTIQADTKAVIKSNEATFQYIRTDQMIEDLLAKLLHGEKIREICKKALGGGALDLRF